jgi:ADP-dependent NAD(P)H-hydrate dehydratase
MEPMERVTTIPKLEPRRADAHKGDFGHVLVVGGSVGMAGAPALAGMAALRAGAGLVTVGCPSVVADVVAGFEPSMMTLPMVVGFRGLTDSTIETIAEHRSTVVALGPGFGRQKRTAELVRTLIQNVDKPIVLDADGLNALVGSTEILRRNSATIVTPHPGEFAFLIGRTTAEVQSNRESLALDFASRYDCVVVLKGAGTVVTDGHRVFINDNGNPGMATGGTGDVLTGVIAGLLAQKMAPFDAAQLGVYLHGLAGDLVAADGAQESLIASDLIGALPAAWRRLHGRG